MACTAEPYTYKEPVIITLFPHNFLPNFNHIVKVGDQMFWGNMFSRVSKWFDSVHNFFSRKVTQVRDSLSYAVVKLRGFFARIIAKLRSFFAAVISKICGFIAATVAKISNIFEKVVANVRSFFSALKTLFRLARKLQKLLSLIDDVLNILDKEVALRSKLLQILKIASRFGDLGSILGGMIHQQ